MISVTLLDPGRDFLNLIGLWSVSGLTDLAGCIELEGRIYRVGQKQNERETFRETDNSSSCL